jgi:hypothetical protein
MITIIKYVNNIFSQSWNQVYCGKQVVCLHSDKPYISIDILLILMSLYFEIVIFVILDFASLFSLVTANHGTKVLLL